MVAGLPGVGWVLLHGGVAEGSTADVFVEAFGASLLFVGVFGGALYWYYGRQMEPE